MIFEFDRNRGLFEARSSGPENGGQAEAVNRPNLTFAVSPKYLSNETKICIFITRIPRRVYIILGGFFKNFIFPISGRYLQASALIKEYQCEPSFLLMYNGIRKVRALDHRAEPAACNDWLT